ncbi:uncharacterized protein LOC129737712 [Uranotaenia lowii]|uniref:uncharacterized protein LOC129737712 n=1 Tax=Uranotaenia lowii TaxID=190385 RepID=UPI0024799018|nr:uncharacterized protein LOC129737712 [Uranotaenia lowii]
MGNYIQSFLTDRTARVFIDGVYSSSCSIHNGVPQGSVIAPTLFLIGLQSVFGAIPEQIETLAYADDLILLTTSPYSRLARKKLQLAVNRLEDWAPSVGFKFAPDKSKLLHFGPNRKKLRKIPQLTLQNQTIPLVRTAKILGVWIDDQLKFTNHINRVRKVANNKLNILKKLSTPNGAGSRSTLLLFLHGWLLPTMLHGIGLYSRGYDLTLRKLEPAYNQAIRSISGAFKSSPISSLMAESGQLPFKFILAKHISTKAIRWLSYDRCAEAPLVLRAVKLLSDIQTSIPPISSRTEPRLLKWNSQIPKTDLTLLSKLKAGTNPSIVLPQFYHLACTKYRGIPKFYTDGSKTPDGRVGCGIYSENINISLSLPDICSVFSSEAFAILSAAQNICPPNSVIFSDSASVLKAIAAGNKKHPWIAELSEIAVQKRITLCWIPGHSQIPGNEKADKLAAAGGRLDPPELPVPSSDAVKWIKRQINLSWSQEWNSISNNKLREIKNSTETWTDRLPFHERRLFTRLPIGHTRLSHEYLMDKKDPTLCVACQVPLSIHAEK